MAYVVWEDAHVERPDSAGKVSLRVPVRIGVGHRELGYLESITDPLRKHLIARGATPRAFYETVTLALIKSESWTLNFGWRVEEEWQLSGCVPRNAIFDWQVFRDEVSLCVGQAVEDVVGAETPKLREALQIEKALRGGTGPTSPTSATSASGPPATFSNPVTKGLNARKTEKVRKLFRLIQDQERLKDFGGTNVPPAEANIARLEAEIRRITGRQYP